MRWRWLYRPPANAGLRIAIALYLIAVGLRYLLALFVDIVPLTLVDNVESHYAPLWVFALVHLGVGLWMILTRFQRRLPVGRLAAGAACLLTVFVAMTWIQASVYTGIPIHLFAAWAALLEAIFIERELL